MQHTMQHTERRQPNGSKPQRRNFKINARARGETKAEIVDVTDSKQGADDLADKYRMAYGPTWSVTYTRSLARERQGDTRYD